MSDNYAARYPKGDPRNSRDLLAHQDRQRQTAETAPWANTLREAIARGDSTTAQTAKQHMARIARDHEQRRAAYGWN